MDMFNPGMAGHLWPMRLVQKGQYKYKPNTNTQCFSMSMFYLQIAATVDAPTTELVVGWEAS